MSVLALTTGNDIALNARKRATLITDPAAAGAQKLSNKFRFFLGEWFLDQRLGVPYYQVVFVKNPDLGAIKQLFRKVIMGTAPFVDVPSLTVTLNAATRVLGFTFRAATDSGAIVTGGSGQAFIVDSTP